MGTISFLEENNSVIMKSTFSIFSVIDEENKKNVNEENGLSLFQITNRIHYHLFLRLLHFTYKCCQQYNHSDTSSDSTNRTKFKNFLLSKFIILFVKH
jgi:hypothetical protein